MYETNRKYEANENLLKAINKAKRNNNAKNGGKRKLNRHEKQNWKSLEIAKRLWINEAYKHMKVT